MRHRHSHPDPNDQPHNYFRHRPVPRHVNNNIEHRRCSGAGGSLTVVVRVFFLVIEAHAGERRFRPQSGSAMSARWISFRYTVTWTCFLFIHLNSSGRRDLSETGEQYMGCSKHRRDVKYTIQPPVVPCHFFILCRIFFASRFTPARLPPTCTATGLV